jgi:hypothetical protein
MFMNSGFRHRANDDGNFDSICLHCFRTVASGISEAKLIEMELQHQCEVEDLVALRTEIHLVRESSIEEA